MTSPPTDPAKPSDDGSELLIHELDAFGAQLSSAGPRHRQRAARRRRLALVAAVLCGGGMAASALAPSQAPVDAVAQAAAALRTDGGVLHYAVVFDQVHQPGYRPPADLERLRRCSPAPPDVWRTTSGPLRWRVRWHAPPACSTIRTLSSDGRQVTGAVDETYADGTRTHYSVADGWADRQTDVGPAAARVPNLANGYFGEASKVDPLEQLRTLVASGDLRDAGLATVDGRALRRLVGPRGTQPYGPAQQNVEYLVDAKSFAPARVRFDLVEPRRDRNLRFEVRFVRFERLPSTPANLAHVSVELPAHVKVRTVDARAEMRAQRRARGVSEAQIQRLEREEDARRLRQGRP